MPKSNNHSADLDKLTKQIAAKTVELQTLKSSLETAQSEWADQKQQIAKDTDVTIATSKAALESAVKDLKLEFQQAKRSLVVQQEQHQQATTALLAERDTISGDIAELTDRKLVLQQTNADLRADNQEVSSAITVNREQLADLAAQKATYQEQNSQLVSDLTTKQADLATLEQQLADKQVQATAEVDRNQELIASLQAEVQTLEQKRDKIVRESMDIDKRNDVVRQNLADWAKKLEEQDANIRIREEKVNQQERSIARNYRLLEL